MADGPNGRSGMRIAIIVKGQDLSIAIKECSELKAFINRIISLCGGTEIS